MSVLVAALGCTLSLHFVWGLASVLAAILFAVMFCVIAKELNIEKSFFHPTTIELELKAPNQLRLDGVSYRLQTLWASSLFLIVVARGVQADAPANARVLLGKDAVSDQQWAEIQTWRVWCQRG
jgi:hypothetical protein